MDLHKNMMTLAIVNFVGVGCPKKNVVKILNREKHKRKNNSFTEGIMYPVERYQKSITVKGTISKRDICIFSISVETKIPGIFSSSYKK